MAHGTTGRAAQSELQSKECRGALAALQWGSDLLWGNATVLIGATRLLQGGQTCSDGEGTEDATVATAASVLSSVTGCDCSTFDVPAVSASCVALLDLSIMYIARSCRDT